MIIKVDVRQKKKIVFVFVDIIFLTPGARPFYAQFFPHANGQCSLQEWQSERVC